MTNNIIILFKQLADCFWLRSFCSHSMSVIVNKAVHMFPLSTFSDRQCDEEAQNHKNTDAEVEETIRPQTTKTNLRWMALSRGMGVGLLGGEELVLWRLRLLSMEGEAWTVILCWKSKKCNITEGLHDNLRTVRQTRPLVSTLTCSTNPTAFIILFNYPAILVFDYSANTSW